MLKPLRGFLLLSAILACGCADDMTADSVGTENSKVASTDDAFLEPALRIRDDSDEAGADSASLHEDKAAAANELTEPESTTGDEAGSNDASTETSTDAVAEQSQNGDEEEASQEDAADENAVPTTPQEYVEAINKKLAPTEMDIPGAIELTEEAYAKFPDDPAILQGLIGLLSQSLRMTQDEDVANQRRLRLGELARDWIERNKDSIENLGNMPVLFLEEAKAHLAADDLDKAFDSVREARELGFKQATLILFYDTDFAELVAEEKFKAEIQKWLAEEVQEQIAQTETFPFDFSLTSFSGEQVAKSDLTEPSKILIVDFWGTWCPPCRKEIPHFVELLKKRPEEVAVVGINIEDPSGAPVEFEEAKARYEEFVQTQPINYPCLAGDRETMEQVPDFQGYPTTLFLDGQGNVRLKLTGYQPLEVLETAVDQLLKQQAPS